MEVGCGPRRRPTAMHNLVIYIPIVSLCRFVTFAVGVLVIIGTFLEIKSESKDTRLKSMGDNHSKVQLQCKKQVLFSWTFIYFFSDIYTKILQCFSLISNGRSILSVETPPIGSITAVHGMRVLTQMTVILVHTFMHFSNIQENRVSSRLFTHFWMHF